MMNFTPVVRTSHSIPHTLQEYAKENNIDVKFIDFKLLSFETLIRRKDCDEFSVVEDIKTITKEDLLQEETQIIQEYTIKIIPLQKSTTKQKIKLTLATNKLKTKALLSIAKGNIFYKDTKLLQELRDMVWKKKLRAGLFIALFEPQLVAQLKKLLQVIPYEKPLSKELKITVASSLQPIPPQDAQLEKIYEKKGDKSIIQGVDEGELIARYIKEKRGKDGRACNGKYITVRTPKVHTVRPQIDDTITVKEYEEKLEYFAKTTGYVVYKENKLCISQTLKLAGADFKSSATIDAGDENRDISVHIEHKKSHSEDAIGSGVKIDVKELNVDGSVGSNVSITTHELNVDAQTHRNSKIEVANQANVKLHRGDMVANDAEIDMLETGKVTAHKSIHIKKMLGGEAIAPVVKVDKLLSNSIIIASERIEIGSLEGENNQLIINPDALTSYHKEVTELKEKIKSSEKLYKEASEELAQKQQAHLQQIKRIKTFQSRIKKATQEGKKPMKQDMLRVKIFKKDSQALQEQQEQLHKQEEQLQQLHHNLDTLLEKDLHAEILCHTPYDGHTKVTFVDTKTLQEITTRPEGKREKITLTVSNDGEKIFKME